MNHDAKIIAGGRCRVNALQGTKGKILYLNLTQTFWCESAAQDGQLCLWPVNGPYLRPSHVSITNADW